jgi:hypothetical protein
MWPLAHIFHAGVPARKIAAVVSAALGFLPAS